MAPEELAEIVLQGLREEQFLILPHPEVEEFLERKMSDRDRWLSGMARLWARVDPG